MHQTPVEYIREKGWEHRQQSGQIVLKTCPFCQDEKWHFYMKPEESGPFYCHKCNEKGNLWTLKKHLGDIEQTIQPAFKKPEYKKPQQGQAEKYYQALLKDQEAISYLSDRGFSRESIDRFKLGVCTKNGKKYLSIPHFQKNECLNIKFRALFSTEERFHRLQGCKSVLFNSCSLKKNKPVYVTEGEFDAITLVQNGIENVVSGTTGAGSFDAEWIDILKPFPQIYIIYDADEKGQQGARSLAKRLGYNRCFNVALPEGMDVNDYFNAGHDIFDFQKLINEARRFDLPGVIPADTALDLLIREKAQEKGETGLKTPWKNVNHLIKGFKSGDLIILSAPPKIGKTSWALNICEKAAFGETPVLFYCLEMRAERLIHKTLQSFYRREDLTENDFKEAKRKFAGLPLYFGYSYKKQKIKTVIELIREAIQRYDLKFVVFDNLHFLIRSISNVNEELGQAVQGFKLLAQEMEIPIMAIAQPRKRESGSRDEIMTAEDVKYSNAIHADCDQMIILHRKRVASKASEVDPNTFTAKTEALDPVTLVRVEAHRYGSGGEALLYFHGGYSRFNEIEKNHQPAYWSDCYR